MSIVLNGTTGITSPGGDTSTVSVTTPKVTNAGALALEATGANIVTASTNGTERARIDSSGNLLIGATALAASTNSSTGFEKLSGDFARLQIGKDFSGTTDAIRFYHRTAQVGSINFSNTNTAYNTSSDYRLKEDVQPMADSITRLMALNPVNFAWKVDGSRVDGFLAHEAQAVVPESVTGTKDAVDDEGSPVYQGIDQSKIVPLLTAALQDAIKRIETLEAQLGA